jgi:hypothetical protein
MEKQVKPLLNIEASCCAGHPNLKRSACGGSLLFFGSAQPLTLITLPTIESSSCCSVNLERSPPLLCHLSKS